MGTPGGPQSTALVAEDVERRLWDEPFAFSFFQAVRLLENLLRGRTEVGRFSDPEQEIVRFRQSVSLAFPSADILDLTAQDDGPPVMTVSFMGLLGAQGVLPRSYTELVLQRGTNRDVVFREFLDLFHHRMLSLFYLAWRKFRVLERASDEPNPISRALLDLIGLGTKGLNGRQVIPDEALLFYAGLLVQQPRSAVALQLLLQDYFEVPVEIEQFVGAWYSLEPDALCTLDESFGINRELGCGVVVGNEVWEPHAKVRVVLGPMKLTKYRQFLPGGEAHAALRTLVRFFSDEIDFEAQLMLARDQAPACELGRTDAQGPRLGWVTWAKTRDMSRDPADTIIPL